LMASSSTQAQVGIEPIRAEGGDSHTLAVACRPRGQITVMQQCSMVCTTNREGLIDINNCTVLFPTMTLQSSALPTVAQPTATTNPLRQPSPAIPEWRNPQAATKATQARAENARLRAGGSPSRTGLGR
jgi:hypothetical protein